MKALRKWWVLPSDRLAGVLPLLCGCDLPRVKQALRVLPQSIIQGTRPALIEPGGFSM